MNYYMFNGLHNGKKIKNSKKQINKRKVCKVVFIVFCIILLITSIVLYITNEKCRKIFDKYLFRKEVYENNLPTIKLESNENINAFAYNKYIAILEQNKLKLYNKLANEETSLDIEISSPIFEINGDYLAIAEKNGQKIYLLNNKNIVWQNEIEGNISSINVNKNGYVSVIISGTSCKTVVQTFDSNGNELFKNYLFTTNVVDSDISNDNKYLAIAETNFTGIVIQSSVKIISIEDAKQNSSEAIKYVHLAKPDDLIINIKYQNKNELLCMYDKHIDILNQDKNTELLNFENEDVLFVDINLSKVMKIVKKSSGMFAESEIQLINSNTSDTVTYALENVPKTVYVQDNVIAVNLGTNAIFINDNGWLIKSYRASQEIQKIILGNDIAGIVSKNKIEVISL